jgi:hypothetical protein
MNYEINPTDGWQGFTEMEAFETEVIMKANVPGWTYANFTSDSFMLEHREFGESLTLSRAKSRVTQCLVHAENPGSNEFGSFVESLIQKFQFIKHEHH